ncbi:MAG: hypothetical protein ACK5HY_17300 [Parahaliea sp.]
MSTATPIKLRIPRQDLSQLSAFPPTAEGAAQWGRSLSSDDTQTAVVRMQEALRECNRVEMTSNQRFVILEALCPTAVRIQGQLTRRFLNQPLVLPEASRQMAEFSESLLSLLSTAYTLVTVHTIQRPPDSPELNPARQACESLQRALEFAGRRILQAFQLYQNLEPSCWLTLHQLYALGERQNLANLPVADLHGQQVSLTSTYLQTAMLSCCKPNQLRQSELIGLYLALQNLWGHLLKLRRDCDGEDSCFRVNLHDDKPPQYHLDDAGTGEYIRYIATSGLLKHLQEMHNRDRGNQQQVNTLLRELGLPMSSLDHLVEALSTPRQRNFSRRSGEGLALEVAVGLSSVHYHIAGDRTFAQFLPAQLAEMADSGKLFTDAGSPRHPEGDAAGHPAVERPPAPAEEMVHHLEEAPEANPGQHRFSIYRAPVINVSPGGYCLSWDDPNPVNMRSGDVLCVREPDQSNWLIAAVRWISALENAQTLIGLELLSPQAVPYGARVMSPSGTPSRPIRVLLLPEIKLVGKPHTLITPRTGFRERQRVVLLRDDEEFLVQLQRQLDATGSYSQFSFRYVRELEKNNSAVAEEVEFPRLAFESLWSHI